MPDAALLPLVALAPVLIAVAATDLRSLKIPNGFSLAALGLFTVASALGMMPDWPVRVLIAAAVFAAGFAAYCAGLFGGGDVKFLSALMLFIPAGTLSMFGLVFSVAMLAGIVIVLGMKQVPACAALGWRSMAPGRQIPMGLSLGLAGVLHPLAVAIWLA